MDIYAPIPYNSTRAKVKPGFAGLPGSSLSMSVFHEALTWRDMVQLPPSLRPQLIGPKADSARHSKGRARWPEPSTNGTLETQSQPERNGCFPVLAIVKDLKQVILEQPELFLVGTGFPMELWFDQKNRRLMAPGCQSSSSGR